MSCSLQRQQRRERREHGIAVIGAAAAVQLVVLQHRLPGPGAFGPALHLRLLVEMAVQQDGARRLAGNLDEDQRRAALAAAPLPASRREAACSFSRAQAANSATTLSIWPCFSHSGSKAGLLVGDADVIGQGGDDVVVPERVHEMRNTGFVHLLHHRFTVHQGRPRRLSAKPAAKHAEDRAYPGFPREPHRFYYRKLDRRRCRPKLRHGNLGQTRADGDKQNTSKYRREGRRLRRRIGTHGSGRRRMFLDYCPPTCRVCPIAGRALQLPRLMRSAPTRHIPVARSRDVLRGALSAES